MKALCETLPRLEANSSNVPKGREAASIWRDASALAAHCIIDTAGSTHLPHMRKACATHHNATRANTQLQNRYGVHFTLGELLQLYRDSEKETPYSCLYLHQILSILKINPFTDTLSYRELISL